MLTLRCWERLLAVFSVVYINECSSGQALSRTTIVKGGSTSLRAIAIEGVEAWTLVVQSTQVIRFNISQAQTNTSQLIEGQYCPEDGTVTYCGYGDSLVSVTNLTLFDATVQLNFVNQYHIQRQHESEQQSNASNTVFIGIGDKKGWNPAYCNHLKIYANNPIKIRVINGVDLSVIWQQDNVISPVWGTFSTMRTSNRDIIQFASETNLTVAKIRAIWSTLGA